MLKIGYTGEFRGRVIEAQRPRRFVFQWPADSGGYDTTVEIDFEQTGEGTVVRLVEHGFEESAIGLQDILNRATGWGEALTLMRFYVEHGLT